MSHVRCRKGSSLEAVDVIDAIYVPLHGVKVPDSADAINVPLAVLSQPYTQVLAKA